MVSSEYKEDVDRSSYGRTSESNLEAPHPYVADLPPDPDAHLSAEERAAIVSISKQCHHTWPSNSLQYLNIGS